MRYGSPRTRCRRKSRSLILKILLVNGPNLNLLGHREPEIYGAETLDDICNRLISIASSKGATLVCKQSNHEGEIVEIIQKARFDAANRMDAIIINPGAYGHTSIALRDALAATALPFIEVHISNVYAREKYRQHSYLSDIANGVIVGLGTYGYQAALQALLDGKGL
jgi:3-dehydroquinate dehydratase II